MIKRNRILVILVILASLLAIVLGVTDFFQREGRRLASDAQQRSVANMDAVIPQGLASLANLEERTCDRLNWHSSLHCEATDTRVYAIDKMEDFDTQISSKMRANGWRGDFEKEPYKYFFYRQSNVVATVEGNAMRYANDASGQAVKGNIHIIGTKHLPDNNGGYFQNTRLRYSGEGLKRELQRELDAGKMLVVITTYNYYDTWL